MKTPIRMYNRFLDLKGELDSYQSLQFGRNYHGVADFELHLNRYLHEAQKLEKGDIIALNKQSNKLAIILTKEIELNESGKESENFKLSGYTLDGLMGRRITVPPAHTSHDRKSGSAEEVMKHYIDKNFINPDDKKRVLPYLEIAPNQNRGSHVSWESRYKNVAEELENISIQSGLGWGVFADFRTKRLIFDVYEAKDLTQSNSYGNNPVFFSPEFETIKSQSFVDSDNDLKNVGYVGGQGEGVERKIVQVGNDTGWQRIETFVDARDVDEENEEEEQLTDVEVEELLEKHGTEKMRDMETLQSLEATILTPTHNTVFQYEKDFDLGDRVDVVNKSWGVMMSAPITEFLEIYEADGFRLDATFGRARPTFINKIKRKFNELEGVEQQELPAQIGVETRKYTNRELLREEQERIRQALENLEASKEFTKDYAEKKRVESHNAPSDKSVVWVDISDPNNVTWKIYSQEKGEWIAGARGPQGLQGPPGKDGQALYTWLKYADDGQGNGLADTPNGKKYMGIAYNKKTSIESTNPDDYEWSKIEGEKGDQGVSGPDGKDGTPRYTWVKYADDELGRGISDSPKDKKYIGLAYNKLIANESDSPKDYAWSLIKGDKGDQGIQGPQGSDGQPRYTWVRYADTATGDGMSNFPDNKKYIGFAYNKTTATESNNASDYTWSKIKGDTGAKGPTGLQGPKGDVGPRGPNIVDTNTSFGVNWLVADYIKSLNGLNINNQFVVDNGGNVSLGSDRIKIIAGGSRAGINIKNGAFTLQDEVTGEPYSVSPKRNLLKDHSFELVPPDRESTNQSSFDHNWLEILPQESLAIDNSSWNRVRNPMVAVQFSPESNDALPILGDQAIVVRNRHYVRQYIYDGVGAGSVYTISAHFKRQWKLDGGVPLIEIWHVSKGERVTRITSTRFERVKTDYSISRHNVTIVVPSSFVEGDSLEVIISGGDENWVQCDGAQMVEGDIATVYLSEDALWDMAKGDIPLKNKMVVLWAGALYPTNSQTIYPSKTLNDCANGWVLAWSGYEVGKGSENHNWQYTYIPKCAARAGTRTSLFRDRNYVDKYFYVRDNYIIGHDNNGSGDNRKMALVGVYEW